MLILKSSLDSKLKAKDIYGYGRDTPDLKLLYRITGEYQSVCTQRNIVPSPEVVEWQNVTFLTAVSNSSPRGSESDGQKLAKNLNEMPILGSLGK